jgi:hypothetical protein
VKFVSVLFIFAAISTTAFAKDKNATVTLWKEWYLYTANGIPQGYFVEELEKRPKEKQVAISQRWFEIEDGGTETFIGAVAKDDAKLTPVAFFSERNGKQRTYKLDGRVKNGKIEMTFKPVIPQGANLKHSVKMEKDMILSMFLSMRIAKQKSGSIPFTAVVEDAKDGNFEARPGSAELQGATKKIRDLDCRRSAVMFNDSEDEWWLTKEGKICEIRIRANQSRLTLTTETEAKAAFGKN